MTRRSRRRGHRNKATQRGNGLTVNQALADPSRVKNKILVGTGKVIADITQSKDPGQEGFANLIFTDRTFSTARLDATLTVL